MQVCFFLFITKLRQLASLSTGKYLEMGRYIEVSAFLNSVCLTVILIGPLQCAVLEAGCVCVCVSVCVSVCVDDRRQDNE